MISNILILVATFCMGMIVGLLTKACARDDRDEEEEALKEKED